MTMNIAIDGPAGAGKSTVAKQVAEKLGFIYIDTGAMYRALTYKANQNKIDYNDENALTELLNRSIIELKVIDGTQKVFIDQQEVTEEIRNPEITQNVSTVAAHAKVRSSMVNVQKQLAKDGNVVMDGRDIGTHVLPEAEVKIFLTASIEERAKRRYEELKLKGYQGNIEQIKEDIASRDKKDQERTVSPLRKADDAILLDTTSLTINEVINKIIDIVVVHREN